MLTIRIRYSCHVCGLYQADCDVPARSEEDVMQWMEMLGQHLMANHMLRSPNCDADSLSDIMIPMGPGTDRIGDPSQN